jgi:YYY domain-containing protein
MQLFQSVFHWYLAVTIIGWMSYPLTYRFFKNLPDRGIAFSKSVGLIITNYIFWLLGSLGFVSNSISGIIFSILLVGSLGIFLLKKERNNGFKKYIKEQKKYIISIEVFFLFLFLGWAILRSFTPNINGTEKPMEFMFLNSILRSPTFPPHDAWLSGHAISYYYFGYLIIASTSLITNTVSSIAFNLGIALIFALTATGSLGIAINLISSMKPSSQDNKNEIIRLNSAFWPGLLAPLIILMMGNYYGVLGIITNNGWLSNLTIPSVWYDYGDLTDINKVESISSLNNPPGLKYGNINFWDWLDIKQLDPRQSSIDSDRINWSLPNWFFASRVIHDRNLLGAETEVIDEIPIFSFILGDMHPHLLSLPFTITNIALAFEWLLFGKKKGSELNNKKIISWLGLDRLIFTSLILGSLIFLNTWDFPIYFFVFSLSLIIGITLSGGWHQIKSNWQKIGSAIGLIFVCSLFLYFFFFLSFQSQAGGILPNILFPTKFRQVVVMFGPVLFCMSIVLVWLYKSTKDYYDKKTALGVGISILFIFILFLVVSFIKVITSPEYDFILQPFSYSDAANLILQRRLINGFTALFSILLLCVGVGILKGLIDKIGLSGKLLPISAQAPGLISQHKKPSVLNDENLPSLFMLLILLVTGALLLFGPEFVYLRDNFGTRMNTVFKFYFQVWILWGFVASIGFIIMLRYINQSKKYLWVSLLIFVIVPGLLYPYGSLLSTTNNFKSSPSLDGMTYFSQYYPDDWAAIQWLKQNVNEVEIILEGTKGAYWVEGPSSRISMATGLPTIMGWVNHEGQWRGKYFENISNREQDIRFIYESSDWIGVSSLLDIYGVKYVIVGSHEGQWYPNLSMNKFERNLVPVFRQGSIVIYEYISKK